MASAVPPVPTTASIQRHVLDAPITAITWTGADGGAGAVYFAAGNTLYRHPLPRCTSGAAEAPPTTTRRVVVAPPGTTISVVEVVETASRAPAAAATTARPLLLLLLGAADHVLAVQGNEDSDAVRLSCLDRRICCSSTILKVGAGRVLRIAADRERGIVLVHTATNELFCSALERIVDVLRAATATASSSSGGTLYADVSAQCAFTRVCGPRLGVVLAADGVVWHPRSAPTGTGGVASAAEETSPRVAFRLFSATYAGEVVEWEAEVVCCVGDGRGGVAVAPHRLEASAREGSIISRTQAHPSGCAIFAVRVRVTATPPDASTRPLSGGADVRWRTHLVSCSDDRSVALYERRDVRVAGHDTAEASPAALEGVGGGWVLLWRGGGVSFARSRVFDVALYTTWDTARRCADVYVGAAGEDGSVQAIHVSPDAPESQSAAGVDGDAAAAPGAALCLVRPHQHRGHGAYRVAFAAPSPSSVTLLSGGFDGAVFAHALAQPPAEEEEEEGGTAEVADAGASTHLRTDQLLLEPPVPTAAADHCGSGSITAAGGPPAMGCSPGSSSSRLDQVRVVHVDAEGRLLACTGRALCVRCDGPPVRSWWMPHPNVAAPTRVETAPADLGMPVALESVAACCRASVLQELHVVSVGCALIGTTTGALGVVPYSCAGAGLRGSRPVCAVAAASTAGDCERRRGTWVVHSFGKITHVAPLQVSSEQSAVSAAVGVATDATLSEFLVATSHVRRTVVLSRLQLVLSHLDLNESNDGGAAGVAPAASATPVALRAHAEWHTVGVYTDCPGALTTAVALVPACVGAVGAGVISCWLLLGDRNGCLLGTRCTVEHFSAGAAAAAAAAASATASLVAVADVHRYVFAEHLRVAIVAMCAEVSAAGGATDGGSASPTTLLTVAGTGGVVEFVYLPRSSAKDARAAAAAALKAVALPARAREPLRLPFDVSSVLAVSPSLWVVQCGTVVSVLHRVPAQSSWVPVGSVGDVRAPRLLVARCRAGGGPAAAFFAHCSDGHTVVRVVVQPSLAVLLPSPAPPPPLQQCGGGGQTARLHGAGLPGKDFTCAAYAAAPLCCVLLGNEDSSLSLLPVPSSSSAVAGGRDSLGTPLSVCGAHHSNVLALAVLPRTEARAELRFVSVGGGAMVNLWAADVVHSPLQLLDWWCGSDGLQQSPTAAAVTTAVVAGELHSRAAPAPVEGSVAGARRIGRARHERQRGRCAASASASPAHTSRIPRFMAVAALGEDEFVVGSSDGTVLFFCVRDGDDAVEAGGADTSAATAVLVLTWQGGLDDEQPRPIMCVSAAEDLVVAGDTSGVVYAMSAATHTVHDRVRLEASCVNAVSELHQLTDAACPGADAADAQRWRFAAVHDSGVAHVLALTVTTCSARVLRSATIHMLCSVSTGLTAGRSVRWPALSLPIVVVTEERLLEFDPEAAQRGDWRCLRAQRVNVRCVSGAAVMVEAPSDGRVFHRTHVAVVGQGVELLS